MNSVYFGVEGAFAERTCNHDAVHHLPAISSRKAVTWRRSSASPLYSLTAIFTTDCSTSDDVFITMPPTAVRRKLSYDEESKHHLFGKRCYKKKLICITSLTKRMKVSIWKKILKQRKLSLSILKGETEAQNAIKDKRIRTISNAAKKGAELTLVTCAN